MNKKTINIIMTLLGVMVIIALIWFLTDFLIDNNDSNDPVKPAKQAEQTEDIKLANTAWVVREVKTGTDIIDLAGVNASINFSDTEIKAQACNSIWGDYTILDNKIVTNGLASTRMACLDNLMTVENILLSVLSNNSSLKVDSQGDLIISGRDNESVRLSQRTNVTGDLEINKLADTNWVLSHYRHDGVWQDVQDLNVKLNFSTNKLGGRVCNNFGGDYEIIDNQIAANSIAMTEMMCGDEHLMDIEAGLSRLLGNRPFFEFDNEGSLIIKSNDEVQFKFRRELSDNTLAFTSWVLRTKDTGQDFTDLQVSLDFSDTQVDAKACNNMSGIYRLDGQNIITDGAMISTLMFCEDERIMEVEHLINLTLQNNPAYQFGENGSLILTAPDGARLMFDKVIN